MTRLGVPASAAAHRPPVNPLRQVLVAALVGLALLQVWLLLYALALSPLQAHHSQGVLYSKLRQELDEQTAPVGGQPIGVGAPIAVMSFPAAGLKREVIVEGTSSSELEKGVGHLRNTVLPGQVGTSTLLGRAQLFGGPFGKIASARVSSTITVTTGEGVSRYKVIAVVHAGQSAPPAAPSGSGQLVLVTADSSGWRSGWAPSKAVYVYANLQTTPYAGSAGVAITKSELPMKGDPGALYVLVLWVPLLFAAVMAVFWAVARWGRWQAWLVGMPIVLATLWGFSQALFQLLPNLT